MSRALLLFLVLAVAAVPDRAWSDPPAEHDAAALEIFQKGRAALLARDWEQAVRHFTDCLIADKAWTDAWFERGNARQAQEDLEGAIKDYTKAIELAPQNVDAWASRARAKSRKGDLDAAIADYTAAIDLDPKRIEIRANRGYVRSRKGDHDGAIADFVKSLESRPESARLWWSLGIARHLSGKVADAIEAYSQAVKFGKNDSRDNPALLRWSARVHETDKAPAAAELAACFADRASAKSESWTENIAAFCLGTMTRAELLAKAESAPEADRGGRICEATFYAGIAALREGHESEAIENFEKAVATKMTTWTEFGLAKRELESPRKPR